MEEQQRTIRAELSLLRAKLREENTEPIDVDEAQELFSKFAEIFPLCTDAEKEALVDAILKEATVVAEKIVEFEFYAGGNVDDVATKNKLGSPSWTHIELLSMRCRRG